MDNSYIDGDLLLHRCVWNNDFMGFQTKFNEVITDIIWNTGTNNNLLFIQGKNNFRYQVYPEYKGHRRKKEEDMTDEEKAKAELLDQGREWLTSEWDAVSSEGAEADDYIAVVQSQVPGIIVSIDKDMKQVPGQFYDNTKGLRYEVNHDEAELLLHSQMLTGDSTDNIKGLTRVGPKTAEKMLKGVPTSGLLDAVRKVWKEKGGSNWEDDLQVCTDLVYLWRCHEDRYDIRTGKRLSQGE